MTGAKVCPQCNRLLPLTAFYKNKHKKDGRDSLCAECVCKREYAISKTEVIEKAKSSMRHETVDLFSKTPEELVLLGERNTYEVKQSAHLMGYKARVIV